MTTPTPAQIEAEKLDIIEKLRALDAAFNPWMANDAADEIERLTAINAELVAALVDIANSKQPHLSGYVAYAALAKVRDGK